MLNFVIDDSPQAPATEIDVVANKAFLETHSGYGLRTHFMALSDHERKTPMLRQSAMAMGCKIALAPEHATAHVYFLEEDMFNQHPIHALRMPELPNGPPTLANQTGWRHAALGQRIHRRRTVVAPARPRRFFRPAGSRPRSLTRRIVRLLRINRTVLRRLIKLAGHGVKTPSGP